MMKTKIMKTFCPLQRLQSTKLKRCSQIVVKVRIGVQKSRTEKTDDNFIQL